MAKLPKTDKEVIELLLEPIPPDTLDTIKAELMSCIEEALKKAEREELLAKGEIKVEIEKTFPTDQVILVAFTLLSTMALETYKEIALPKLKERFKVKTEKSSRKKKR